MATQSLAGSIKIRKVKSHKYRATVYGVCDYRTLLWWK